MTQYSLLVLFGIATGKFSEKLSHRTTNLFVATYIRELFAARKKAR